MSDVAIKVEGLGKLYKIGKLQRRHDTLRDRIADTRLFNLFKRRNGHARDGSSLTSDLRPLTSDTDLRSLTSDLWALKDVSFEVKRGEVVGIIGRNGAGKSTLLKILSRITEPTEGYADINGRVASLLEVGTGFNSELTGRENIYLNGSILGMKRADIVKKFDEIVAFAEVEKFIDTPVKRYSSGMYLRLAFAVAAHLEPEILLVDEVLAVGDAEFQKKCLGKMSDVAKEGRTVLFVSHNMSAIRKLCERTLLIGSGRVLSEGKTGAVLEEYLGGDRKAQSAFDIPPPTDRNLSAWARTVTVLDGAGNPTVAVPVGQPWQISVDFSVRRPLAHFIIAAGLLTSDGNAVRVSWSNPSSISPGEYRAIFREDIVMLGSARYGITVGLSEHERTIHYVEDAGILEIASYAEGIDLVRTGNAGAIMNPLQIEITKLADLI